MKKIIVLIIACLFFASCASINPYDVPESEGVYLKYGPEFRGKSKFFYIVDNVVTSEGRKDLDIGLILPENPEKRIIKLPSGELSLGLSVYYYPEGDYNDLSMAERLKFAGKVGELVDADSHFYRLRHPYEIHVINPEQKVAGLEGIKINAIKGNTYQIKCKIEDGKAYIWIEDNSGSKVSETVRGVGSNYPNYWLWETLPQPDL